MTFGGGQARRVFFISGHSRDPIGRTRRKKENREKTCRKGGGEAVENPINGGVPFPGRGGVGPFEQYTRGSWVRGKIFPHLTLDGARVERKGVTLN